VEAEEGLESMLERFLVLAQLALMAVEASYRRAVVAGAVAELRFIIKMQALLI
jgi:hypothetical protein